MENLKDILILGIETSCDDTCASVVLNGSKILSNVVASQHDIHEKYGGVVPELASRRHVEIIDIIIKEALIQAGINFNEITAVAVTNRPGLVGSLLVGVGAAKAIAYAKNKPLIAVNHLKAHLFSNFLENQDLLLKFDSKFIGLIVSGGHSSIYIISLKDSRESRGLKSLSDSSVLKSSKSLENLTGLKGSNGLRGSKDSRGSNGLKNLKADKWHVEQIGHTIDDAAGEAFDKIARFLGLGYPGGPIIDKISKSSDSKSIEIPRPMINSSDYNFSFSGLKTAVIYKTKKEPHLLLPENIPNLVASFQEAIVDVLVKKTILACKNYRCDNILISGGVAANSRLREAFLNQASKENINVYIPSLKLCLDNAAMVACLGYYEFISGNVSDLNIDVYSRSDI